MGLDLDMGIMEINMHMHMICTRTTHVCVLPPPREGRLWFRCRRVWIGSERVMRWFCRSPPFH